jgi:translation initiation factor 4A
MSDASTPSVPSPTLEVHSTADPSTPSTFEHWDDDTVNLKQELMRGIYSNGFEEPSPIQKKAIIPFIEGKDLIAQAQSGTGKTGAFTVGLLQRINDTKHETQAIALAPTRELARQISQVMGQLATQMSVTIKLLIGGTSLDIDRAEIAENCPHIVVGCPGRVHDMLKRGIINPDTIRMLVLDEADEMLSAGFKDQVYNIFQFLSADIQVGLFSATIPSDLRTLTDRFMRNPVTILVKQEALTLQGIQQFYVNLPDDEAKFGAVKDIFGAVSVAQCIIYCNSIHRVDDLYDAMQKDGFPVIRIHSDMNEVERRQAHEDMKTGKSRVLIATDLFARGIDIQQVSYVINFDIPKDIYNYIHRIGRSGRWGRKGVGINFSTRRDQQRLQEIEQFYHTQIEEMPMNWEVPSA